MTPETVDSLMNEYLANKALVLHLQQNLAMLRKLAENAADVTAEDLIHITQVWSTDPHGNAVSHPTENAAIQLADGDPGRRSKAILEEANKVEKRIEELKTSIGYVDAWLTVLNAKERIVVDCKAIQQLFWRETAVYMEKEFGVSYSAVGLKRIYKHAMDKVYALAGQ